MPLASDWVRFDPFRHIHTGMFSVRVPDEVSRDDEADYVNEQIQQMSALSMYNQTMQQMRGMRWGRPRPEPFIDVWYIHPGLPESIQRMSFQDKLERWIDGCPTMGNILWPDVENGQVELISRWLDYAEGGQVELISRIIEFQKRMDELFRS